ncbi:A/G-specific adenine glycosylase [Pseudemcibacter aquimaris]|uniref:A/G-specific adenine glycosylase n=1 Tax=Pseudemcibacter aquimaris TaxID=2857064 RepID=UPI002012D3A4|nr:A/G-specific adenine glycosylase [Pseudemcibacter aquimaris]MCC3862455.1 A/G-specific adenine glycosylase [Pseudemcibacter aquimaris]WDU59117.1 A/G-specific adenine glycosylase [Pseudemcibacter aquimaris]
MNSIAEITDKKPEFVDALLDWYDHNARTLPWRISPEAKRGGIKPDPYHVWLSEIMLQQTTVATVKSYFEKFMEKWPTLEKLAEADLDDVLTEWAGLGYYARARNLYKCARTIHDDLGGNFPKTNDELLKLPGIGVYTAAAISSIAYDIPETVVDGNVERVLSRLCQIETPLPDSRPEIRGHAEILTPDYRPGDYAQALMDLGATICTPKSPKCGSCPLQEDCLARKNDLVADLPRRKNKKEKETRRGYVFWAEYDGKVWLRRRPEKGLLGGMMEVPSDEWAPSNSWQNIPTPRIPIIANWKLLPGVVRHTFTHFHLELKVVKLQLEEMINLQEGEWCDIDKQDQYALPTVMKKVFNHVGQPLLDL